MLTLLSLNAWQGSLRENLMDFLASKKQEVNIFCFQEVPSYTPATDEKPESKLLTELEDMLNCHKIAGFAPFGGQRRWWVLTMVSQEITVLKAREIWIHENIGYKVPEGHHSSEMARSMMATILDTPSHGEILVCNVHGFTEPVHGKADTPERIEQSKRILEYVASVGLPTILMGDFNLRADTESVRMFVKAWFRNLIDEYGITSTRPTQVYEKPVRHADFVFLSPDFKVESFEVLDIPVSDHCPMIVKIL